MKIALNSEQMRQVDTYTIQEAGIPARILMERAAACCAEEVWEMLEPEQGEVSPGSQRVIGVLAGVGNNGGDAVAMIRCLRDDAGRRCQPIQVRLLLVGNPERGTVQWKEQMDCLEEALEREAACFFFRMMHLLPGEAYHDDRLLEFLESCDLLVDGLFGIGLSREVSGIYAQVLRVAEQGAYRRLAIDMPSGISADTGCVLGVALRADVTVTFGYVKWGQLLEPGRSKWCGMVLVKDIGFAPEALAVLAGESVPEGRGYVLETADAKKLLPVREAYSHKGTFGNVGIVGGMKGMAGAVITAGMAAYRAGSGLVTLSSCEENRQILQMQLPEAVYISWETEEIPIWKRASALVVGPGLGKSGQAKQLLEKAFSLEKIPLVLDADALNWISENEELETYCTQYEGAVIMTPHVLELSRLLHCSKEAVQKNLPVAARSCARRYGAICVAKDAVTVIAAPEGYIWLNTNGNHGMATGGSGDALAGIIGSLLGQGMSPYRAAALGVWLHGAAGDEARKVLGARSVMARDIVAGLSRVLKKWEEPEICC